MRRHDAHTVAAAAAAAAAAVAAASTPPRLPPPPRLPLRVWLPARARARSPGWIRACSAPPPRRRGAPRAALVPPSCRRSACAGALPPRLCSQRPGAEGGLKRLSKKARDDDADGVAVQAVGAEDAERALEEGLFGGEDDDEAAADERIDDTEGAPEKEDEIGDDGARAR